jgi:fused signal recognition particle receptor
MQAIEQQMHHSPLCLAHEVMARLGPQVLPGLDDEAAYVDAAATRIQSIARGRLARRDLAEQENAARMIQARVRGFQTRAERREEAIREAKAAAEEAAAIYAKEEAEAVAAEAAYAKEEAEALAAEAAHRKEEAEALAAEADARREEEEALLAEADARREEAEAVEAEKVRERWPVAVCMAPGKMNFLLPCVCRLLIKKTRRLGLRTKSRKKRQKRHGSRKPRRKRNKRRRVLLQNLH